MDTGPPAPALAATADRSSGTVTVIPIAFRNEFPGFSEMFIFLCRQCGDAVKVAEALQ
jgi:hypothetical protein